MIVVKIMENCPRKQGQTILDVANDNNIEVPTLCHDVELNPYGSCWVCAVKVEGIKGFVTACGTQVYNNMEIITDSSRNIQSKTNGTRATIIRSLC